MKTKRRPVATLNLFELRTKRAMLKLRGGRPLPKQKRGRKHQEKAPVP